MQTSLWNSISVLFESDLYSKFPFRLLNSSRRTVSCPNPSGAATASSRQNSTYFYCKRNNLLDGSVSPFTKNILPKMWWTNNNSYENSLWTSILLQNRYVWISVGRLGALHDPRPRAPRAAVPPFFATSSFPVLFFFCLCLCKGQTPGRRSLIHSFKQSTTSSIQSTRSFSQHFCLDSLHSCIPVWATMYYLTFIPFSGISSFFFAYLVCLHSRNLKLSMWLGEELAVFLIHGKNKFFFKSHSTNN